MNIILSDEQSEVVKEIRQAMEKEKGEPVSISDVISEIFAGYKWYDGYWGGVYLDG